MKISSSGVGYAVNWPFVKMWCSFGVLVSGEYNRTVVFSYLVGNGVDRFDNLLCFGNSKTSIDKIILWVNPDKYIVRLFHDIKILLT